MPLAIEFLSEARADRALFNDGKRRRQGAGTQEDGEVIGALDGKAARNLAGASQNGLANDRRRYDLIVEDDGKRPADILLRDLRELART